MRASIRAHEKPIGSAENSEAGGRNHAVRQVPQLISRWRVAEAAKLTSKIVGHCKRAIGSYDLRDQVRSQTIIPKRVGTYRVVRALNKARILEDVVAFGPKLPLICV